MMKYIDAISFGKPNEDNYPIIVHSHLRWDWVWQRPQQFLSRLSKKHRILFIEAPNPSEQTCTAQATLREVSDYPNIIVLQIQMPAARWTDGAWVDKSGVASCNRFSLDRLAGISIPPCNGFTIRWR